MPIRKKKITCKPHHIRGTNKTVKLLKKSDNMVGGWFDFLTQKKTKFAYIMAELAYKYSMEPTNNNKDYSTSDYDEKTKQLLMLVFRKIFIKYINEYRHNTEIRDGTNKKSLDLVINSVEEYKKTGDYKYDIVKYKSSMQYSNYVKKLEEYIKDFINYFKTNSNNATQYHGSTGIQQPEVTKSSTEQFATIIFYDRNKNTVKIPNILYRISRPQIPSNNKYETKTRIKYRYNIAHEFLNSYSQYVNAFNYYVKYRVDK